MNFTIHIIICSLRLQHDTSLPPAKKQKLFISLLTSLQHYSCRFVILTEKNCLIPTAPLYSFCSTRLCLKLWVFLTLQKLPWCCYVGFFSHGKRASSCQHLELALYKVQRVLPFSTKKFYCYRANIPSMFTISQQIVLAHKTNQYEFFFFFFVALGGQL